MFNNRVMGLMVIIVVTVMVIVTFMIMVIVMVIICYNIMGNHIWLMVINS